MRTKLSTSLIFLALGLLILVPSVVLAYTTLGYERGVDEDGYGYQRDVRIYNNFEDPKANENVTPDPDYPGALGAALAIWKGAHEWDSNRHGLKNFDYDWQGNAPAAGDVTDNTVSARPGGDGSTLAWCLTGDGNAGWKIEFMEKWQWDDGPGAPATNHFDIQGVGCHELGHALGLGHTNVGCNQSTQPTMCPAVYDRGLQERTIEDDDQNGLGAIYGNTGSLKPVLTSISGNTSPGHTITLTGSNFDTSRNHVKFTAGTTVDLAPIPGVVYDLPSYATRTMIDVVVPPDAQTGNIIVWRPGTSRISNPLPITIGTDPPPLPVITGITPDSVKALERGTIEVAGSGFVTATQVTVGATVLGPGEFTIVNDGLITFDAPVPSLLGPVTVTVTNPAGTSNGDTYSYVEQDPPLIIGPTGTTFAGRPLQFDWGATPYNTGMLIVNVTGTTMLFNGSDLLWPFYIVYTHILNGAGLGSLSGVVPNGFGGITIYYQLLNVGTTVTVSNIDSFYILF
ncbi:MAG: IPT/TIG domain-containing protein [Planctomycetota bacterium]